MGHTILVVTVGRRDVQIRLDKLAENSLQLVEADGRSFILDKFSDNRIVIDKKQSPLGTIDEGTYVLLESREGGKTILENERFMAAADFPIVRPVIENLLADHHAISYVVLIYTDQADEWFRKSDTLYFSSIIAHFLKIKYDIDCDEYPVSENPNDIDFQYVHFKLLDKRENERLLPIEEVDKVYLLAQGGIDQINFALSLRLIETYREKLVYLHKPEKRPVEMKAFPDLFVKNLTRNQAISLIENQEFKGANAILLSETLRHLMLIAQSSIDLNFNELGNLLETDFPISFYQTFKRDFQSLSKQKKILALLFISLKHDYYKSNPNNLVWKFRTIAERMLRPAVIQLLGFDRDLNDKELSDAIKTAHDGRLLKWMRVPIRPLDEKLLKNMNYIIVSDYKIYVSVIDYFKKNNTGGPMLGYDKLIRALDRLKGKRDKLIHEGVFTTMHELTEKLELEDKSIKDIIDIMSSYFGMVGIPKSITKIVENITAYSLRELES